jgi:hypothetical protein
LPIPPSAIPQIMQQVIVSSGQAGSTGLSFYFADVFIHMNGTSTGTSVSTANLATGTAIAANYYDWDEAAAQETFAAGQVSLPATVSVRNGSTYPAGTATQSIAYDHSAGTSLSRIMFYGYEFPSPSTIVVISGYITFAVPNQSPFGSLFDYVVAQPENTGTYAALQLQSGNAGLSCGNIYAVNIEAGNPTTHSSCITITPGSTYYYSFKVDWSSNKLASLNIYTTAFSLVGSVTEALSNADTLDNILIGNNEDGTASGSTSYFQDTMIDYTNHVFPNLPH